MVTHPPAPLSPLSLEQSKASHQALAILDDVQAWHEAGHESGGGVGGHPGDGVPGDDARVAGHAVKLDGTSNYRNVVGVSVATARTAHSSRAGDTAVPKNLVVSALGAGPRPAAERQRHPARRCLTRSRYRRLCWRRRSLPCSVLRYWHAACQRRQRRAFCRQVALQKRAWGHRGRNQRSQPFSRQRRQP